MNRKDLNDMIRGKARRSDSQGEKFTNAEMNRHIRGESIESILARRPKPKEREMTPGEIQSALVLMDGEGLTWTEARAKVLGQVDEASRKPTMNDWIRGARGKTEILKGEENEQS